MIQQIEQWPARISARAIVVLGIAGIVGTIVVPRAIEAQNVLYTVWGGGPTYPTGLLAHEKAATGYNIQADAIVRRLFTDTGLRLGAAYDEFPTGGPTVGAVRLASATANLAVGLGFPEFALPYAFAGGGYYFYRSDVRLNQSVAAVEPLPALPVRGTRSAAGLDAGVGVRVPLPRFSVILEGRDDYVFFGRRQLNMVPVTLGVAYTYPMP